ncbi:BMP family ABC transporter substrate-binding protein [Rhodococcus sp. X156]|uniref:BMP family ABC transporter substrate-binding protein n=1 Tax=Rhodococcus sp. X156 TaxID=2499145 RepID=UPI000FD99BC7|nr:BMP family ABC transporter substrate-binding protein [Rhodococcus sp. X156]
MRTARATPILAGVCALALGLTGCADRASDTPDAAGSGPAAATSSQPDVNGDGKVVIGVISPGDLNDNGYYESFVSSAQTFADSKGWSVIKIGSVNPANASEQARNLCRQKVDLVALAAAELKDAIPVAADPECAKTAWYAPSSTDLEVTPYIALSRDFVNESMLAAGYANGILMRDAGMTKAGYITGPQADFSVMGAKAFEVGLKMVVPSATLATTYTGDFNDSAKAREAAQAQLSQGVQALYPYLGGATDSVAELGSGKGAIISTPGTDRCGESAINWSVSVVFDPGAYFSAALKEFADGKLAMGKMREWHLGKDSVPTVLLCKGTDAQKAELNAFIAKVGSGEIVPDKVIAQAGA